MTAQEALKDMLSKAPAGHPMIATAEALIECPEMLISIFPQGAKEMSFFMRTINKLIEGKEVSSNNLNYVWTFDGNTPTKRVR